MKRLTLAAAVGLLAFPASALAASARGVVLSVDRQHHAIQVVDSSHHVRAYHFRGRLPAVHLGSVITFVRKGSSISHVAVASGSSHTVSFYARVVRAGKGGLLLRLPDGRVVKFKSHQIKHKRLRNSLRHQRHSGRVRSADTVGGPGVTINILGLQPGVTVLVTETVDSQGNVTITITIPSTPAVTGEQSASGVVGEVDTDAFDLLTGDGSTLRLHMGADQIAAANLQTCDTASVTYHQDGELLVADSLNVTGTSTSGDCAPDANPQDVVGTITDVSSSSITITTQDGQQSMTFSVDDPSVTDGFAVGDVVDVTYLDSGNGSLSADDVEYVEQDVSGTVTSVSDGSLTITDDQGNSDTFTADPSSGMFDGVAVGDYVDVVYHTSAGGNVADEVDDQSSDWGGGDWGGTSGGGD